MIHERNLTLLLLAQVLLSLIGYLPLNIQFIKFILPAQPATAKSAVSVLGEVFSQSAFCWNVFIYIGMSRSFRKEFLDVVRNFLCFICHKTGNNRVHVL